MCSRHFLDALLHLSCGWAANCDQPLVTFHTSMQESSEQREQNGNGNKHANASTHAAEEREQLQVFPWQSDCIFVYGRERELSAHTHLRE